GALGFSGVGHIRQGKVFDLELEGADKGKAEADLKAMCEKLLSSFAFIMTPNTQSPPDDGSVIISR
ncbi:phosphoribosylformylglycinamidine synthase subunit PurS, partial [Rhizobium ruizarguesonis]